MAMQFTCQKHNLSYVTPDIRVRGDPSCPESCPECRREWEQQEALHKARSPEGYTVKGRE